MKVALIQLLALLYKYIKVKFFNQTWFQNRRAKEKKKNSNNSTGSTERDFAEVLDSEGIFLVLLVLGMYKQ